MKLSIRYERFLRSLRATGLMSAGTVVSMSWSLGVCDEGRIVSGRAVDSHVEKLRRRLATPAPHRELIRSVHRTGYRDEPTRRDLELLATGQRRRSNGGPSGRR